MALVLADRVRDTTTTTGTGTITLGGVAPTGYQTFGTAIGNTNTTYYTISGGAEWEVGLGTYSSTGPTLSRDTVLASSAGGTTKVNFSAGSKDVFVTYPAGRSVLSADPTITNLSLVGTLTEDVYTITDAAGFAIDPTNGSIQLVTLGASRTPTQANWASGQGVTLMINDGSAFTITWTTIGVVWAGGSAPTLATSGYTVVELWKVSSTVYGALVGNVA